MTLSQFAFANQQLQKGLQRQVPYCCVRCKKSEISREPLGCLGPFWLAAQKVFIINDTIAACLIQVCQWATTGGFAASKAIIAALVAAVSQQYVSA